MPQSWDAGEPAIRGRVGSGQRARAGAQMLAGGQLYGPRQALRPSLLPGPRPPHPYHRQVGWGSVGTLSSLGHVPWSPGCQPCSDSCPARGCGPSLCLLGFKGKRGSPCTGSSAVFGEVVIRSSCVYGPSQPRGAHLEKVTGKQECAVLRAACLRAGGGLAGQQSLQPAHAALLWSDRSTFHPLGAAPWAE